jgi:hypothetical protein
MSWCRSAGRREANVDGKHELECKKQLTSTCICAELHLAQARALREAAGNAWESPSGVMFVYPSDLLTRADRIERGEA